MIAKQSSRLAVGSILLATVVFGFGAVLVAWMDEVGSYAVAFWRMFIAGMVSLPFCFSQFRQVSRDFVKWCSVGGACLVIDLSLWHESVHAIGPGLSTVLNSLQVFFMALFAYLFFHQKLNLLQMLIMCLAVAGVVLMMSPELSLNEHAAWGIVSGILSGMFFALSICSLSRIGYVPFKQMPLMMLFQSIAACTVILPIVLWMNPDQFLPQAMPAWTMLMVYGVVIQCLAWGTISLFSPRLNVSVIGLLLLAEPVAAIGFDIGFFGKQLSLIQYMGIALTLGAIYWGTQVRSSQED